MNRSNRRATLGSAATSWANHVIYQLSAKYGMMPAAAIKSARRASACVKQTEGGPEHVFHDFHGLEQ